MIDRATPLEIFYTKEISTSKMLQSQHEGYFIIVLLFAYSKLQNGYR